MAKRFSASPIQPVLSVACGTGRFMEYATDGLDLAPAMIEAARRKFPDKAFQLGSALEMPFDSGYFEAIFALHFVMHLPKPEVAQFVQEAFRLLRPGGRLIVDFPSARRRRLVGDRQSGWHGATAYDLKEWRALCAPNWHIQDVQGLLFFPIHRLPTLLRAPLRPADSLLGRSPLREFASYLILEMHKR